MQRFESLRSSAYGVTYAQTYLAHGRYAEALTSSGLEGPLVNPATPAVTFRDVSQEILPAGATASSGGPASGGVILFDVDADGHLDILDVNGAAVRLLRKNGRVFTDISAASRLTNVKLEAGAGAVAGDYDNDGRPDLLLFGARGYTLLHQEADHTFADVTSASALPRPTGSLASAAFADVDHDGDLDIVTAGTAVQMLRNNGNGSFTDITAEAGLSAGPGRAFAIAP